MKMSRFFKYFHAVAKSEKKINWCIQTEKHIKYYDNSHCSSGVYAPVFTTV